MLSYELFSKQISMIEVAESILAWAGYTKSREVTLAQSTPMLAT